MPDIRFISVLLVGTALRLDAQCADGSPPPCASPASAVTVAPARMSIAVLPLENRSPDTTDVYFAEGMTDEIANQLARLGKLQVRARGMVAAQWRRTPDPLEAARRLNVAWLVHGHVRHTSGQLLVNVELIRTATGEEAWAARFPRRDNDVFAVQSEVAESVAVAVGGRLSPLERSILAKRPTRSNEAYRLYLLGNSLQVRRTPQDLRRAIEAYKGAIKMDSTFAPAWARLAVADRLLQSYDNAAGGTVISAEESRAVRRAMALDSTLSDVWLADGMQAYRERDLARGRSSLERAVKLDSLNEEAVGTLGFWYLWYPVDSARAEPLIRRAIALNPDRKVSWLHLHYLRFYEGHLAEASALLDTVQGLGPWQPALQRRAELRACMGDGPGALAAAAEADRMAGGRQVPPGTLARYRVLIGDSSGARQYLARARVAADTVNTVLVRNDANMSVAALATALGQYEEAITALQRVVLPDADLYRSMHSPCYDPLRKDPRFAEIMSRARAAIP